MNHPYDRELDVATLNVTLRDPKTLGKNGAFALRKAGRIPAVLYGRGRSTEAVSADLRDFNSLLKKGGQLLDLSVDGAAPVKAVLKAVHHGLYDADILHADFRAVSDTETIQLEVPIECHGDAPGLSVGGVLDQEMRMIAVRCLPRDIPHSVRVPVGDLNIGDTVFADQLPELPGVAYVFHGRPAVVSCRYPQRADDEAASPADAATQPEVMAEKASEARAAASAAEKGGKADAKTDGKADGKKK